MEPSPDSRPHPRLFVPAGGFTALKAQVRTDAPSRRIFECLQRKADQFCAQPVSARVMEGYRLLNVSRTCLERILTLALAAQLTGAARYVRRAADEMLAAAAFTDWNPSHYLDTAEMTLALATGYDWLFDLLPADERETIATALREKGIGPSLDETAKTAAWIKARNNWNQVCHAGMVAGALALAERDPAMAERIVSRAVANVPAAAAAYAPDGAYAEGPMYWDYGTSFHVALISALESALGHDYGLADSPGFLDSAHYICQVTGPTGLFFDYSDSQRWRGLQLPLFWFARRVGEPALAETEIAGLDRFLSRYEARTDSDAGMRLLALVLTWHRPLPPPRGGEKPAAVAAGLPRHWRGLGVVPVAVHRSAWNDPQATFVGFKGGSPAAPHGHMDAGSFVLEVGGVRWGCDLGMQDYHSMEKLGIRIWNGEQSGGRWTVFRNGSQGHNVPSFNGAQQLVTGDAPLVRFVGDDRAAMPHTVADLSTVYADHVTRAWRGVGLLPDGRVVLQDEWTAGTLAVNARWQMLTFAQVTLDEAHGRVVLRQNGKELELRVDQPPGVAVTMAVEDRSQPVNYYDAPNPGLSTVVFNVHTEPGHVGALRVVAGLSGLARTAPPEWQELARWSAVG